MNRDNFIIENFKNHQELIKFADQKVAAILVIASLLLTTFVGSLSDLNFINPFQELDSLFVKFCSIGTFIFAVLSFGSLIFLIIIIVLSLLKPRKANEYIEGEYSLFYYEHINNMSRVDFIENIRKEKEEELDKHIITQIYELARILNKKNEKLISISKLIVFGFITTIIFLALKSQL
jgi:hypothetical protein